VGEGLENPLAFVDEYELAGHPAQAESEEADGGQKEEEHQAVDDVEAKRIERPHEQCQGAQKANAVDDIERSVERTFGDALAGPVFDRRSAGIVEDPIDVVGDELGVLAGGDAN